MENGTMVFVRSGESIVSKINTGNQLEQLRVFNGVFYVDDMYVGTGSKITVDEIEKFVVDCVKSGLLVRGEEIINSSNNPNEIGGFGGYEYVVTDTKGNYIINITQSRRMYKLDYGYYVKERNTIRLQTTEKLLQDYQQNYTILEDNGNVTNFIFVEDCGV